MLISIITPSYNQSKYLSNCIESVSAQTYAPIEHLIYDPGSTDNSREIASSYASKYLYIKLIFEPDNGQADAVSKGMQEAKGDIIGWLNSDDMYFDGNVFKRVIDTFKQYDNIDFVYGLGIYIDQNSVKLRDASVNPFPLTLKEALHTKVGILQPSVFIKKSAISKIGVLNRSLDFCMDYEYWIKAINAGMMFHFLPYNLAKSRYYSENKTKGKREQSYEEIFDMLMDQFGYIHYNWAKRYAEYLIEGFDGIIDSYSNNKIKSNIRLNLKIRELLEKYNCSFMALNLIRNNKNLYPYNRTFNQMKSLGISFDTHYKLISNEVFQSHFFPSQNHADNSYLALLEKSKRYIIYIIKKSIIPFLSKIYNSLSLK